MQRKTIPKKSSLGREDGSTMLHIMNASQDRRSLEPGCEGHRKKLRLAAGLRQHDEHQRGEKSCHGIRLLLLNKKAKLPAPRIDTAAPKVSLIGSDNCRDRLCSKYVDPARWSYYPSELLSCNSAHGKSQ